MAKIVVEGTSIEGQNVEWISIEGAVGPYKASNVTEDILAVQALLQYMTLHKDKWTRACHPVPNGCLDQATRQMILDFQEWIRKRSWQLQYWVEKDGRISPVQSIFNDNLPGRQRRTLYALNEQAMLLGRKLGMSKDYIKDICRMWPHVATVLERNIEIL